jgi:hypothetical protein
MLVPSDRRHGPAQSSVAAIHEVDEPSFKGAALQQNVPPAASATQPDVRSQTIHQPFRRAAGMHATETNHVSQPEVNYVALDRRHLV